MQSFTAHKKGFTFGVRFVILAAFFAVLVPVSASAADNWCATYRTNGMRGPVTNCFSSQPNCAAQVNVAKVNAAETPPTGAVITDCFDKAQPITTPSQQFTTGVALEQAQREEKTNGFITGALYLVLSPVLIPLAGLSYFIFKIAGVFLVTMAKIMDWSISVSINSQLFDAMQFVNIGWTAVRDFANMFFIFALLYIAIQTILGLAGGNAKRVLVHIIIAALLVNFSLFATKVVVDAGNIVAVSIWIKLKTQQGPTQMSSASAKILGGLDLQTVFENAKVGSLTNYAKNADVLIAVYAGGAVFMFIAGYMFLAGALMMITRTIMLLLLMVFSPFAFMALGLPKLETYGHQWLDKLLKQTFVAPFFIFMLYITSIVVDKMDIFTLSGSKGFAFADVLAGGGGYQIIFNFILMIGFLVASLSIANSFAGNVGSNARGWAKSATKWAGGMATAGAVGTGAFAMRQGLGKVGMMGKDNQTLHDMAAEKGWRGMVGRGAIAVSGGMARATYDPRATKLGTTMLTGGGKISIGQAGGKGGREATGSILGSTPVLDLLNKGDVGADRVKEILAKGEQRYKNDPAGRAAFYEANLGTYFKDGKSTGLNRYENDSEFKTVREAIATQQRTQAAKDVVKNQPEVIREEKEKLATLKANGATEEEIKNGEKALTDATKKLKEAVDKLSGKEFAEMVTKDMLMEKDASGKMVVKPELINAMGRQHAAYLNANPEIYDQETRTAITNEAMLNGRPEFRQYAIQQAKMGTAQLLIDLKEEMKKRVDKYDANLEVLEKELKALPSVTDADKETLARKRQEILDLKQEHDDAVQDILGGMKPKDVARMEDRIKSHKTVVQNYTDKHLEEIENYHKNIKQDVAEKKQLFADIRKNAKKKYMDKAEKNPKSAYYNDNAKTPDFEKKETELRDARQAAAKAKADLDAAKTTSWQAGKLSDAEKAHQAAQEKADRLQKEIDEMNRKNSASSSTATAEDDEVEEDGNPIT